MSSDHPLDRTTPEGDVARSGGQRPNRAWTENPLNFSPEDIEYCRDRCTIYIIARSPSRGLILKGGLGFQGMGIMWGEEQPRHAYYRGYDDAINVDTTKQPMTDDFGNSGEPAP